MSVATAPADASLPAFSSVAETRLFFSFCRHAFGQPWDQASWAEQHQMASKWNEMKRLGEYEEHADWVRDEQLKPNVRRVAFRSHRDLSDQRHTIAPSEQDIKVVFAPGVREDKYLPPVQVTFSKEIEDGGRVYRLELIAELQVETVDWAAGTAGYRLSDVN